MSLVMGRLPLRRDHRVAVVDRNGEAGLRTSGSTPALPAFPTRWGQWLRVSRVGGCSPVTAAGPCRIHTGFPILPTIVGHLACCAADDGSRHAPGRGRCRLDAGAGGGLVLTAKGGPVWASTGGVGGTVSTGRRRVGHHQRTGPFDLPTLWDRPRRCHRNAAHVPDCALTSAPARPASRPARAARAVARPGCWFSGRCNEAKSPARIAATAAVGGSSVGGTR